MAAAVATSLVFHMNNNNTNNNNNYFGCILHQSNDFFLPTQCLFVEKVPSSLEPQRREEPPPSTDDEELIIGDLFADLCEVVEEAPSAETDAPETTPVSITTSETTEVKGAIETSDEETSDEDEWECPEDDWSDDDSYDDMNQEFEEGQRWERKIYNPKHKSGVVERLKKDNKKERITKRVVAAARYRVETERSAYAHQQYLAQQDNSRKEQELKLALARSLQAVQPTRAYKRNPAAIARLASRKNNNNNNPSPVAAVLNHSSIAAGVPLSLNQIQDMQNRELTPEDYELLLLLDASLPKKTLSKSLIDDWETITIKEDSDDVCCICMCNYAKGEKVKLLPCSHKFHCDCIETWLTKSSVNCPVDGLPLKKD